MKFLRVIQYDQWGFITIEIRGQLYEYETTYPVIEKFLRRKNQGRALAFLKKNSYEVFKEPQ